MKKIINTTLTLLLVLSQLSCQEAASKDNPPTGNSTQNIELIIDGTKKTADPAAVISAAFTSAHFMLGYLSDKDDLQFSVSAFMQDVKPGTYQVYDCKSAGECDDKMPDNNQIAMFGPYPKDPMPALNLFRTAYYAPTLGLQPLTLTITSVTDEQQEGNPFKTKRITGKFSGNLADVEQQQGGYDWHVVKTSQLNGSFNVLCSMR